jgi:hypothetical protein
MPSPSHHIEFALYADDTAVIATSRKPTLLVNYLESCLIDLQRWLSEWRIAINVSKSSTIIFVHGGRRFIQPRPVSLLLGPLLNRKSDLSVRNGMLLYKQLIRPMMDYVCPAWRSAARTRVWGLQVLQSKCLRLATSAPWYVSNRQIHEDLGVPLSADHIRALTVSFDSKLADGGTP